MGVPAARDAAAPPETLLAALSPEVAQLLTDRRAFLQRLDALSAAGLPAQLAQALLRSRCASDFNFLARACGIPACVARALDTEVLEHVKRLAGPDGGTWSAVACRRVFHPLKEGGLGFTSVELTAEAAHAASWHAVAAGVATRLNLASVGVLRAEVPWAEASLAKAAEAAREVSGDALAPSAATPGSRLRQRDLAKTKVAEEVGAVAAELEGDPAAAAQRLSARGPGAGAWLLSPTNNKAGAPVEG